MGHEAAIIEFGSGKITVLKGKRGVNGALIICGQGECEYAGFMDGEWLRPDKLSSSVEGALRQAETDGQKIKNVFIGVPAEFSTCVTSEASVSFLKRKKITEQDIEKLLEESAPAGAGYTLINRQPVYYNLDGGRRVIDPIGEISGSVDGLVSCIYAEDRFLSYIDNIMMGLGIESAEYVSSPLAQGLFLIDANTRDKQAVLIDIGYITGSVSVINGDGILSLSSFSMGGGNIAADLNGYFNISFAESEALKRKALLSVLTEPDDVYEVRGGEYEAELVNKIVSARLSLIAKAILKSLENCAYEIGSAPFYLTGGGVSYMHGAKEILQQELGREIEIVSPPLPNNFRHELTAELGLLNMVLEAPPSIKKKKGFLSSIFKKQ